MAHQSDQQLLGAFVKDGSQQAFEILVRRYNARVYASACKKICNKAMAEDVCQLVFLNLAKQASSLLTRKEIGSWLCQVAYNQAIMMVRTEERRKRREQKFSDVEVDDSCYDWTKLRPILDKCLFKLPVEDRNIIVWHYFENKTFPEVARICGGNVEAVKKRSQRALLKLAFALKKQRVSVSLVTLTALLSRNSSQAASDQLAGQICNFVANHISQTTVKSSVTTKVIALASVVVLSVASLAILKERQASERNLTFETKRVIDKHIALVSLLETNENKDKFSAKKTEIPVAENDIEEKEDSYTPEQQAWWDEIYSDNPAEMVKNLKIAGFPDVEVEHLFSLSIFQELVTEGNQVRLILEALRTEQFEEKQHLSQLWQNLNKEYTQGSTFTLEQGNLPDKLFETFLSRLALIHEKNRSGAYPEAPSQQIVSTTVKRADSEQNLTNLAYSNDQEVLVEEHLKNIEQNSLVASSPIGGPDSTSGLLEEASLLQKNQGLALNEKELNYLSELYLSRNWTDDASIWEASFPLSGVDEEQGVYSNILELWDFGDDPAVVADQELTSDTLDESTSIFELSEDALSEEELMGLVVVEESIGNLLVDLDELYFASFSDENLSMENTDSLVLVEQRASSAIEQKTEANPAKTVQTFDAFWHSLNSNQRMIIYMVEIAFRELILELESMNLERFEEFVTYCLTEKEFILEFELGTENYQYFFEFLLDESNPDQIVNYVNLTLEEIQYLEQLGASQNLDPNPATVELTSRAIGPSNYLLVDELGYYINYEADWSVLSEEEQEMIFYIEQALVNVVFDLDELYYSALAEVPSFVDLEIEDHNLNLVTGNVETPEELWNSLQSQERLIIFLVKEAFGKLFVDLEQMNPERAKEYSSDLQREKNEILLFELGEDRFERYQILF